jgi:hypothetical protein
VVSHIHHKAKKPVNFVVIKLDNKFEGMSLKFIEIKDHPTNA